MSDSAVPARRTAKEVLRTPLCDLFGIDYPVIQTGMGWVSGVSLTAATSSAGGLGILAAVTMDYDQLVEAIDTIRARTDKPFGVNLRADQNEVEKRIQLLIDKGVNVASFAGAPRKDLIQRLNEAGIKTMPTIGMPRHAVKMQEWGVSAVIAQGHEGGGHTGPVPTSLLLPGCTSAASIPVVGAGGFKDGSGLVAAMAWGAAGIAMGTRFLLTQESRVPDEVKQRYLAANVRGTVVTKAIDGHPQRVIQTEMIQRLESSTGLSRVMRATLNAMKFKSYTGTSLFEILREGMAMRKTQGLTWPQLIMAANAPMLTKMSMVDGRAESGILPTGQVTGVIEELPTVEALIGRIMQEAEDTLVSLGVPRE